MATLPLCAERKPKIAKKCPLEQLYPHSEPCSEVILENSEGYQLSVGTILVNLCDRDKKASEEN